MRIMTEHPSAPSGRRRAFPAPGHRLVTRLRGTSLTVRATTPNEIIDQSQYNIRHGLPADHGFIRFDEPGDVTVGDGAISTVMSAGRPVAGSASVAVDHDG
jgi:hypothetical protein